MVTMLCGEPRSSKGRKALKSRFSASSFVLTCVVMPTWQVPSWQPRQIVQPSATIASVAKPTAVGAEANHLDHIASAFHAAIDPKLDIVSQAAFDQMAVRQPDADLRWQANVPQGMRARGAGATGVAGNRDDIGARFGDADGDDADARGRPAA